MIQVKLWRIPEEDNNDDDSIPACLSTLSTPSRRVDSIVFHPTADQVSEFQETGVRVCVTRIFVLSYLQ